MLEPVFPYENEYERSLEREVGAGRESTEESTEETGEGCEPLRSRGSMQSRTSRTRRSRMYTICLKRFAVTCAVVFKHFIVPVRQNRVQII